MALLQLKQKIWSNSVFNRNNASAVTKVHGVYTIACHQPTGWRVYQISKYSKQGKLYLSKFFMLLFV